MRAYLLFASLIFISTPSKGWIFEDYDDCILDKVKASSPVYAVKTIKESCAWKHYKSAPFEVKLSVVKDHVEHFSQSDPDFGEYMNKINKERDRTLRLGEVVELSILMGEGSDAIRDYCIKVGFPRK